VRYNGYENKPTWLVPLWIDNEEGTYHAVRDFIAENGTENLRDFIEEMYQVGEGASINSDMLGWAWAHVNWDEVVEALSG